MGLNVFTEPGAQYSSEAYSPDVTATSYSASRFAGYKRFIKIMNLPEKLELRCYLRP